MSIVRAIQINHFDYKVSRNWDKTYWFFDIHGTILKPNYSYGKVPTEFYAYAKEALQYISTKEDIVMCIYTCSHPHEIAEYVEFFKKNNIKFQYINENPEVPTQMDGYGCYDKKPYMNVLFEDKAGFDPEKDWLEVLVYLQTKYGTDIKPI